MKWLNGLFRQAQRMLLSTKMTSNSVAVSLAYDIYDCDQLHQRERRTPVIVIHGLFSSKRRWAFISKNCNKMTGRKVR